VAAANPAPRATAAAPQVNIEAIMAAATTITAPIASNHFFQPSISFSSSL
jgi:hypothetical protein